MMLSIKDLIIASIFLHGIQAFYQSSSRICPRITICMNIKPRGPADKGFLSDLVEKFFPSPEQLGLGRYDKVSLPGEIAIYTIVLLQSINIISLF